MEKGMQEKKKKAKMRKGGTRIFQHSEEIGKKQNIGRIYQSQQKKKEESGMEHGEETQDRQHMEEKRKNTEKINLIREKEDRNNIE